MKKFISLWVLVLTMTFGLSLPALAIPDYGTVNQFTIEQATLDMDVTISLDLEIVPALDIEMKTELIYLEGTVIIGPSLFDQIILTDQAIMQPMNRQDRHESMLSLNSYGEINQETYSLGLNYDEGSPQLGTGELLTTRRFLETCM